jgi:hypothetical protein
MMGETGNVNKGADVNMTVIDGSTADLFKSIGNHVPDSPALILYQISQGSQQDSVAGLLLLGDALGDANENLYSE